MRLTKITIDHYRSIEHAELFFYEGKPLVLFGGNNAGKSNIISAINRALGERHPKYIEMEDSDYFMRDRSAYPISKIRCDFDSVIYASRNGQIFQHYIVQYDGQSGEHQIVDEAGSILYLSNQDRERIQAFIVDAERDINRQLSYYSKYSLLSKFSHAIHAALSSDDKDALKDAYNQIKETFRGVPEYQSFFEKFHEVVEQSVKGFVHDLKVDFSAYDPNNYAQSMRVLAFEGDSARTFEEFGTGEQQILLMAFAKAYVETFGAKSLVLVIEEPEAHLHPLAQRWLKEYIYELCEEGLQVVLSTHSPDFVDITNLDGIVRVTKNISGVTSVTQLTKDDLVKHCIELGVPNEIINTENVLSFYGSRVFPDESKGFFANKVLIVEGPTEYFALPELFHKLGHSLAQEGIEIVNARGKTSIPYYWRLFDSFGIECFTVFDGDAPNDGMKGNDVIGAMVGVDVIGKLASMVGEAEFSVEGNIAFFSKDFECYMEAMSPAYSRYVCSWRDEFKVTSKTELARAASRKLESSDIPDAITDLWNMLTSSDHNDSEALSENNAAEGWDEDIPF